MTVSSLVLGIVALAQAPDRTIDLNPIVESLQVEDAPAVAVLSKLFRAHRIPHKIQPGLHGNVTAALKRVPLVVAVRCVVNQVDALHEVREGAYFVFQRDATPSGRMIRDLKIESPPGSLAIAEVFRRAEMKFELSGAFNTIISLPWLTEEVSFEFALRAVLEQVAGDYQVKNGVYHIQKGAVSQAK